MDDDKVGGNWAWSGAHDRSSAEGSIASLNALRWLTRNVPALQIKEQKEA